MNSRVTRGSCPAVVTYESRCLETKRTNISLYCYRCVMCEPWFPMTDPGMSLVTFKGSHSIFYGPCCLYAGGGSFCCSPSLFYSFGLSSLLFLWSFESPHLISLCKAYT